MSSTWATFTHSVTETHTNTHTHTLGARHCAGDTQESNIVSLNKRGLQWYGGINPLRLIYPSSAHSVLKAGDVH